MAISKPKSLQATSNRIGIAFLSHQSAKSILLSFLVVFFTFRSFSRLRLLQSHSLLFDPISKLVEHFLGERKLLALEKLCHLGVDKFTGIFETALCFSIITFKFDSSRYSFDKRILFYCTYNM